MRSTCCLSSAIRGIVFPDQSTTSRAYQYTRTWRKPDDTTRLPDTFDVKAIVRKRPDLFRQGASKSRLENWKNDMRSGKRLPSWIRDIENEQDRRARIDLLTTGDMFRSQFRTEADAPRSSIEVIDWGLQHIDRLRKARVEALTARYTSWQLWSVIVLGVLNIIVT